MMSPASPVCDDVARDDVAPQCFARGFSRALKFGIVLGLAALQTALVGCGDDKSSAGAVSQGGGVSTGSLEPGPGGAAGAGGASTSGPAGAGGSGAGTPGNTGEGGPSTDIPLGSGGTGGGPSEPEGGVESEPDAAAPVTEPVGFAPCPTDGSACRVMPLGDSITDGIDMTIAYASNGGYRLELFRLAVTAGHDITFVGTRPPNGPTGDVAGQPFPRNHEGISGNTIQQVADRVDAALVANPPHIVLLQIGTNNLYQGMAPDVPGQLASLIDQITDGAPEALVAVAQITPLGGQFPNNGVDEYNAAIPGIVQERVAAGKHLIVVDQFNRIASTPNFVQTLLPDNIHPNAAGYAIMGESWYGAIETFLP